MSHEFPLFADLLVLLLVSVPIAFISHRLRLPVMVGFMITGVLIGPSALGLISVAKTLKELDLRHQTGATVTAVVRDGNMEINPGPELRIEAGDILVLIGKPDQIRSASVFIKEGKADVESDTGKTEADKTF